MRVCSLWKAESQKDGTRYLSGNLNDDLKVLVFPRKNKSNDRSPDYDLIIVEREGRSGGRGGGGPQGWPAKNPTAEAPPFGPPDQGERPDQGGEGAPPPEPPETNGRQKRW